MFKLTHSVAINENKETLEKSFSAMINYKKHYNDFTIQTSNNDLIFVIKIEGFSSEAADDIDLESKKQLRNGLFKGLEGSNVSIWSHTIRRRYGKFPNGEFKNIFTQMLNDKWKQKHNPENSFVNEHYITLIKHLDKTISNPFSSIIDKVTLFKLDDNELSQEEKSLSESYKTLIELKERLSVGLAQYKPKVLGIEKTAYGDFSEICEFLSYIANIGYSQKMKVPRNEIRKYINTHRLYFHSDKIECRGLNHNKFAGMISLKEYRPGTFAGMFDSFLKLPFEFILSQSYSFIDKTSAITKMQLQQRRLMQSEDVAISQVMEIDEALDSAMSGAFGFGLHHLTIMPIADNEKTLDTYMSQAVVAFSNIGISATIEKLNMEPAFWAQFPGQSQYIVRKATINTLNLASYISLHNFPFGKIDKNHWGDAVTVMNTTSGTPYYFSFHTRDVGHTMIIGPTGGGKTLLMNFLCAQAQKFNPKLFFFDKDRGAELFIRAIDGNYTIINPGNICNFNPLFLDDTPENRNFLLEWIKSLLSVNGEIITAEESAIITNAISGSYRLPKEERKLSNIAAFFGIEKGNNLAVRLKLWHSDGMKAKIFDNDIDMLDFSTGRTFSFDMAEIMKDKAALSPVLLYIFHKINLSLDGSPTMVVLDEAWALIDNPVFAPKIKDWLKVMRKLNAFVVFATQSVEDAAKSQISDTLVQQTATQIFLPNLKATDVYKEVFMLSDREYYLVKNTDPSARFFLLKQDSSAVIAKIDLSGMKDLINILSGTADLVRVSSKIREIYGDKSDSWLPKFFEEINNQ